jgi:CBS domain-containing protein
MVASIVGFSVFGAVHGFTPIFGRLDTPQFDHPVQLLYYAVLGVAAGLFGRLYARALYRTVAITKRLRIPAMLKPALAGVLVGLVGLAFPEALATGYGWLQQGMNNGLPDVALWVILLLPFVKIATTSLSIGSGGSGGIFGPGMVVGGFVGLGVWRILHGFAPGMPDVPAPFMVVGMIACFGSVAHAPLGLMLMVAEMTGSLALLPPAMIAIGLAAVVVRDDSIYESQLRSRADAPSHRARFGLPLLGTTPVRAVMRPPRMILPAATPLDEARGAVRSAHLARAPVVDAGGRFLGVVSSEETDGGGGATAGTAADIAYPTVSSEASLDSALDAMVSAGTNWVPVLERDRIVGVIAMADVIGGYQTALRRTLRLLTGVTGRATLIEATVGEGSAFAGAQVSNAPWPAGAVAVSIDRRSQLVSPTPDTQLQPGDVIVVVAPAGAEDEIRVLFGEGGQH